MDETTHQGKPTLRDNLPALILVLLMTFGFLGFFIAYYKNLPTQGANGLGVTNDLVTPTASANNLMSSLDPKQSMNYHNVKLSVTRVEQARGYSDDKRIKSPYVIRVYLQTNSQSQNPEGIDFPSISRLQTADGKSVQPVFGTLSPLVLPKSSETGYLDFPSNGKADLTTLRLKLEGETLPFK